MNLVLLIVALALILLRAQEYLRCAGGVVSWSLFLVLPILLTPYWMATNEFGIFAWVKLYSILLTAGWISAIRFTGLGRQGWPRVGVTILFGLNILEAIVLDLAIWRPATVLNAASGVLLIVLLPRSAMVVSRGGRFAELYCHGLGRLWILAYSMWNFTFLFSNFPVIAGHHIAVLGAALIVGLVNPKRWLQARFNGLALDLMLLATVGPILVPLMDTTNLHGPIPEIVAAFATWMVSALCFACQASGWNPGAASDGQTGSAGGISLTGSISQK